MSTALGFLIWSLLSAPSGGPDVQFTLQICAAPATVEADGYYHAYVIGRCRPVAGADVILMAPPEAAGTQRTNRDGIVRWQIPAHLPQVYFLIYAAGRRRYETPPLPVMLLAGQRLVYMIDLEEP